MGKKILSTLLVLLVITGCSQNTDEDGISGKNGSVLKETLEQEKQQKSDEDQKDDEKEKSDKEDQSEVKTNQAEDAGNKTAVNEQSKSNEKTVESSKKKTEQSSSGSATEAAKPSQPQKPAQQESSQPSKPAESTPPSKPTCNDTIPAGAYPKSKENEICSQIEAEMVQNAIDGKPTFYQYEIEYGTTECGTEYFYIIPIY